MEENNRLTEWTRRRKSAQALALRARIVLACAHGELNGEVARRLHVTLQTVGKWRQRFIDLRLDGLLDAPRPGQPRKIDDAKVEEVIARTLESKPSDATHWSTRQMAKAACLNQTAVGRIWRAFGLQRHRPTTWIPASGNLSGKARVLPIFANVSGSLRLPIRHPPHRSITANASSAESAHSM